MNKPSRVSRHFTPAMRGALILPLAITSGCAQLAGFDDFTRDPAPGSNTGGDTSTTGVGGATSIFVGGASSWAGNAGRSSTGGAPSTGGRVATGGATNRFDMGGSTGVGGASTGGASTGGASTGGASTGGASTGGKAGMGGFRWNGGATTGGSRATGGR
jgi:hypothetical protein